MTNTPSNAEIEKLAAEHLKAFAQFTGAGDVWVEGEVAFARAVLAKWGTQPQAGAVPQRWKAVPVNPTPEMWKAAKTVPDPNPPYPPHYGLVWDAMLAASPTPQSLSPACGYFSFSDECGFDRHDTVEAAKAAATEMLADIRSELCGEEWPMDVESICWGVVVERAAEHETTTGEDGEKYCDYMLKGASPTPQSLSAAPVEVADAMADSQYLAGVSAGWNAANADNPNEALRKLHKSRAGYLKPLDAARKQGGA